MNRVNLTRIFLFLSLIVPWSNFSHAGSIEIVVSDTIDMDDAGKALRQVINAFETSPETTSLPQNWSPIELKPNEAVNAGQDIFLTLIPSKSKEKLRLKVDQGSKPKTISIESAEIKTIGSLQILWVLSAQQGDKTQVFIRLSDEAPQMSKSSDKGKSPTKITGLKDQKKLVIETPDSQTLRFAESFMTYYNKGMPAEESARLAREHFLSEKTSVKQTSPLPENKQLPEKKNIIELTRNNKEEPDESPLAAQVTLHLVKSDAASFKALISQGRYSSSGQSADNPHVKAASGPQGGKIVIGDPGDKFQLKLRVLEQEGKAHTETQTIIRVPLGGETSFSMGNMGQIMEARIWANLLGTKRVELRINSISGDWGSLGYVSTTVQIQDGETLPLAQNTYTREVVKKGGVPILRNIPFIGPVFGSSSSRSEEMTYALFATLKLE